MKAFILGFTGIVGRKVLQEALLDSKYSSITLIGRRTLNDEELTRLLSSPAQPSPPLDQYKSRLIQKKVDFDKLSDYKQEFDGHNVGFLCLGTTRADAGSAANFYKIDHDYVYESAKLYKESPTEGPKSVMLLTSTGSNEKSSLLYLRTKGELERDIKALDFDYTAIFRPAYLLLEPNEQRSKPRFKEQVTEFFSGLFGHPKSWAVQSRDVAKAMVKSASVTENLEKRAKVETFENIDIINMTTSL